MNQEKDESLIPPGQYCYSYTDEVNNNGFPKRKPCPYWSIDLTKPDQGNGSCSFLNRNDWDDDAGVPLLWDQIKSCNINNEHEEF